MCFTFLDCVSLFTIIYLCFKFSCTDVYNITLAFIVQAEDKSQLVANKLPIVCPATLFFLGSKNVH